MSDATPFAFGKLIPGFDFLQKLATGGGAVLAAGNREAMRERGLVVYLKPTAAELWQRLRRDRHRPLLQTPDPRGRLHVIHQAARGAMLQVA